MDDMIRVDVEKVAEENPQSRFRVVDNANLNPGVCALCGSAGGDGRQFVDFGKTMEWYGVVYFCTWCIAEAAKLLGFVPLSFKEQIETSHNEIEKKYYDLVKSSQEKLDAAMVLLRDHLNGVCGTVTSPVEIPEAELVEPEPSSDDDRTSIESEPDSDESAFGEGFHDVSATSDVDEPVTKSRSRRTSKSDG